jgi:hypothetical protein
MLRFRMIVHYTLTQQHALAGLFRRDPNLPPGQLGLVNLGVQDQD